MKFVINVFAKSIINKRNELNIMVQHTGLSNNNYVLEQTRAKNVLDIVLTSQKECIDNVMTREPMGSSEHIIIQFIIKAKGERN